MMSVRSVVSIVFLLLIVMIGFPQNTTAVPASVLQAAKLIAQSDLVCKGKVTRVDEAGEIKDNDDVIGVEMIAQVKILRVLKGNAMNSTVEVGFQRRWYEPYADLQLGEYILLFLKQHAGQYALVHPYHGKILISGRKLEIRAEGTTPLALVQQELVNSLGDEHTKIVLSALERLRQLIRSLSERLQSQSALQEIGNLTKSQDVVVRGAALEALIRLGDYSHIDEAIKYLDAEETVREVPFYKVQIARAFGLIRDPSLVPQLHALLQHRDDRLRGAVAGSLRNIQSKSSIPYFVAGLDDPNVEVRYHCMMALAKMFDKGGQWAPGYDLFLQDESQYLSRWKDWWEKEGKVKFLP